MKRFIVLVLALSVLCLPMEARRRWIPKAAAASGTTFITGQTLGTDGAGNNGYELGLEIDVQGTPISITQIGFYVISGSTGTHAGRVYGDPFGTPTLLGSVSLNMNGLSSGWYYVALGTPVALSASTNYVVVGDYSTGTDHTYDIDTTITHTAVAVVPNGVYRSGGSGTFGTGGTTDHCYVPMGFKYN